MLLSSVRNGWDRVHVWLDMIAIAVVGHKQVLFHHLRIALANVFLSLDIRFLVLVLRNLIGLLFFLSLKVS
jgi:hypothetical protein